MRNILVAVLLSLTGGTVQALEMHPPWIHDTPKPKSPSGPPWVGNSQVSEKSPYYPPWIAARCQTNAKSPNYPPWVGTKCHQQESVRGGVWAYPLDWREIDWSQADSGAQLHQWTQGISLKIDAKIRGDNSIKPRDAILEYYRDPPSTGPSRLVK